MSTSGNRKLLTVAVPSYQLQTGAIVIVDENLKGSALAPGDDESILTLDSARGEGMYWNKPTPQLLGSSGWRKVPGAGTTLYNSIDHGGDLTTTEAEVELQIPFDCIIGGSINGQGQSQAYCSVVSTAGATMTLRKNSADTAISFTWAASTPGWLETGTTITCVTGDLICLKLVTPSPATGNTRYNAFHTIITRT